MSGRGLIVQKVLKEKGLSIWKSNWSEMMCIEDGWRNKQPFFCLSSTRTVRQWLTDASSSRMPIVSYSDPFPSSDNHISKPIFFIGVICIYHGYFMHNLECKRKNVYINKCHDYRMALERGITAFFCTSIGDLLKVIPTDEWWCY